MIFEGILNLENNFTEILKNLCEYKLFKSEFLKFLDINYENIDDVYIETQYSLEGNGIVDLHIKDEEKIYLIEIKIKFNTSLSKHQFVKSYEKWAKKNNAIVKYLIPKKYKFIDEIKDSKIYYLEELMKYIKLSGIYELNCYIKDFIDFYYKFLWIDKKYTFNEREIQLIKGEKMKVMDILNDVSVPELMEKLYKIVDEVKEKIGYKKTKSQDSSQYGFDINFEKNTIWFGIYYKAWQRKKRPFIVWVYEESINSKQKKELKKMGFEFYEDGYEKPAYIYLFSMDELQNLDNLVVKIEETIDILNS